MAALDIGDGLAHSLWMSFPAFQDALETYFGEDAEISSPEDESDAWKSIVDDFRDGAFIGLLRDTQRLLTHSDREIFEFLRSVAPAWTCGTPADARRSIEVFQSYVQAHSD
jgi:hypothetical protein